MGIQWRVWPCGLGFRWFTLAAKESMILGVSSVLSSVHILDHIKITITLVILLWFIVKRDEEAKTHTRTPLLNSSS